MTAVWERLSTIPAGPKRFDRPDKLTASAQEDSTRTSGKYEAIIRRSRHDALGFPLSLCARVREQQAGVRDHYRRASKYKDGHAWIGVSSSRAQPKGLTGRPDRAPTPSGRRHCIVYITYILLLFGFGRLID